MRCSYRSKSACPRIRTSSLKSMVNASNSTFDEYSWNSATSALSFNAAPSAVVPLRGAPPTTSQLISGIVT